LKEQKRLSQFSEGGHWDFWLTNQLSTVQVPLIKFWLKALCHTCQARHSQHLCQASWGEAEESFGEPLTG